jgi:hypothetical protein
VGVYERRVPLARPAVYQLAWITARVPKAISGAYPHTQSGPCRLGVAKRTEGTANYFEQTGSVVYVLAATPPGFAGLYPVLPRDGPDRRGVVACSCVAWRSQ